MTKITVDTFVKEVTSASKDRTVVLYLYNEKMVLPPSLFVNR